jgi:hypothetical protein
MSRWAETFVALSRGDDTVDTLRHIGVSRSTVSYSVNSVTAPSESATAPPSSRDDVEEARAGIIEYVGNIPRAWVEGFAQLDPGHPPAVPARRWLAFIDDCGRFLDGGFAARAAALGWGPLDVFGLGPRPALRPDRSSGAVMVAQRQSPYSYCVSNRVFLPSSG